MTLEQERILYLRMLERAVETGFEVSVILTLLEDLDHEIENRQTNTA